MRLVIIVLLLLPPILKAEEHEFGGHIKGQSMWSWEESGSAGDALAPSPHADHELDLRLNALWRKESFEFVIQGETLGIGGDGYQARKSLQKFIPGSPPLLADDRRRLFDLSHEVAADEKSLFVNRLDRLSFAWLGESAVIRAGRQAVTWGNGLIFQTLDLFNPFSPEAIDKEYKTGDDLLSLQYQFSSGSDLQVLAVPRRDISTHQVESSESSYAAKFHGRKENLELDYDLLLSRHYNQDVLGGGISKGLWDGVLRFDAALTRISSGRSTGSLLINYDRSFSFFEKNSYAFIEYFYNGFGEDASSLQDVDLSERLLRGELFTISKHYLALGTRIELDPRWNLYLNEIANISDGSGIIQLRNVFDLAQNITLMIGLNLPYGENNSEYGGLPLGETGQYLIPAAQAYGRLAYYF